MEVVTELNVIFDSSVGWAKGNISKKATFSAGLFSEDNVSRNMPACACALVKTPADLGKFV